MPLIQALFFDIGDTLVFDDPPLKDRIVSAAQSVGTMLNPTRLPEAFRTAEAFSVARYVTGIAWDAPGAFRETVDILWSALGLPLLNDEDWTAFASVFVSAPFMRYAPPEAFALLDELKRRGFVIGAISDWEDTLPEVLSDLSLLHYFDALAISSIVGATKPNAAIFEAAVGQVGLPPSACLHIGDWCELDVAGARAAGMSALLFDWAGRSPAAGCPRVTTWAGLSAYLLALPAPG